MKKSLFTLLFSFICLGVHAQLGYWTSMGFVELTPDESITYKYVLAMDDESQEAINSLYASLKAVGDKSLIKCNETGLGGWYVKKDYPLPEGNYFESDFYNSNSEAHANELYVFLPKVRSFINNNGRIEDLLDYLGDRVTVDFIKKDEVTECTDFEFISNLKTSEEWLKLCLDVYNHGFEGLHYFAPTHFMIDRSYWNIIEEQEGGESVLIAEIDWTTQDGYYYGYIESNSIYIEKGVGLIIKSDPVEGAQYWEPQVPMIANIPELEKGGHYLVIFTIDAPTDGEIRLDLCSWDGSGATMAQIINVKAGEKEYQVDFLHYPTDCNDALIFYQCGHMPGQHIIKKVQVFKIASASGRGDETAKLGYWAGEKFLFIELTPDNANNYRYVQTLDEESENALDDLMADAADEAILKFIENRYFVKNDIRLPEGKYFESPIYISSEEGVPIVICPRIVVSLKEGYEIDGLLEQLGSKVTVERSETAYEGGIRYYLACQMNSSEEVLEAVRIISGFIESGGIRYFEPEMYNLSFTMYGEGESLIDKLKGGDETAINAVKATKADDAIYNLNGQRVNASYKGLVIKNGKKVVIK